MTDKEIFEKLKTCEIHILGELYRIHRDSFVHWLLKGWWYNADADEAMDTLIEGLYRLKGKIVSGDIVLYPNVKLKTLLFNAGRFAWLEKTRKMKKEKKAIDEYLYWIRIFGLENLIKGVAIEEVEEKLVKDFEEMKESCQDILLLYYLEGLSDRQIAESLGSTEGAIRMRRLRCKKGLGDGLDDFLKAN